MLDILKLSIAEPITNFNPQVTYGSLMEEENIPEVEDEKFVKQQNEYLKELNKPVINQLHDNLFRNESKFNDWFVGQNSNLVSGDLYEQEARAEEAQINMFKTIEINNALQNDNIILAQELLNRQVTDEEIRNKSISGEQYENRSYLKYENKVYTFAKNDPQIQNLTKTLSQMGINYNISTNNKGNIIVKSTTRYLIGYQPADVLTEEYINENPSPPEYKEPDIMFFEKDEVEEDPQFLKSLGLEKSNYKTTIKLKLKEKDIKSLFKQLNLHYNYSNVKDAKKFLRRVIEQRAKQATVKKQQTKTAQESESDTEEEFQDAEQYDFKDDEEEDEKQKARAKQQTAQDAPQKFEKYKIKKAIKKEEEDDEQAGEGVTRIKPNDRFVPLGKYQISMDKLRDNIIKVVTMKKNRTGIPHFYTSSKFKDLILRALKTQKIYSNDIMNLSQEEQAILDTILTRSKADVEIVQEDKTYNAQSKKHEYMTDRSLKRRLKILMGEITAGNNNNDLKREIKLLTQEAAKRGIKL